jgi:DNA-binding HxlR family transcriptional regulator
MMYLGQSRFNQLLASVEGISPKTLSVRLREMERDGLIKRKIYHEVPLRVEYIMTEKGNGLKPLLEQMAQYSMTYYPRDVLKDYKAS